MSRTCQQLTLQGFMKDFAAALPGQSFALTVWRAPRHPWISREARAMAKIPESFRKAWRIN